MAIPWLAILKSVPWTDVINNAPKVAEGAKKLWNSVSRKSPVEPQVASGIVMSDAAEAPSITVLQSRLAVTEAAIADLHNQMLASSELIKSLAEQNAQLIKRIEDNRVRVKWLTVAVVIVSIVAMMGLVRSAGG
ncbi:MAG: hypothetical protein AB7T07_06490 [Steroidobacteraceae bacterium]